MPTFEGARPQAAASFDSQPTLAARVRRKLLVRPAIDQCGPSVTAQVRKTLALDADVVDYFAAKPDALSSVVNQTPRAQMDEQWEDEGRADAL